MDKMVQCNVNWHDDADAYLHDSFTRCSECTTSSNPKPSKKESLSALNVFLKDTVIVEHFFLDGVRLFHTIYVTI